MKVKDKRLLGKVKVRLKVRFSLPVSLPVSLPPLPFSQSPSDDTAAAAFACFFVSGAGGFLPDFF